MTNRVELTTQPVKVGRLLLLALATTFVAEYSIMKILPHVLPANRGDTFEAIADACILTLIVAPVLWLTAVLPIQRLAQSRMHFLRRSLTTQEEERQRITRDIHDGIGQSLTSLLLGLRAMEETTTDPTVCENARALRAIGASIHDDLRQIVRGLRPAILDQLGLVAAAERLVDEVRAAAKIQIDLEAKGLKGLRLEPELESNAFRILQEAISNALRHSAAKHVQVNVLTQNNMLELAVVDDGKGFDPSAILQNKKHSYGLLSIRERAMIRGGRAEIQSSPGSGTIVMAHLPLVSRSHPDE